MAGRAPGDVGATYGWSWAADAGAHLHLASAGRQAQDQGVALAAAAAEGCRAIHRHEIPRFERVSWRFVDSFVESTVRIRGWWRNLPLGEQNAIAHRFWQAGRLTLEYWLTPRLAGRAIHRWPGAEVIRLEPVEARDELRVRLSNTGDLSVDHVIFATGYRADLARVPYLAGVLDRIATADGFPILDDAFGSSLSGLYLPGFTASRDFGPFFGFIRGCPAAATLIVQDLLTRPR